MAVEQPEVATVVEREIRIAARPETVFEFFVDPQRMCQWKGRKAELDPRPGGVYRVEINDQAIASGEYVEIDSPSRVVFTWGWEGQESGSSASGISICPSSPARSTGRAGISSSAGSPRPPWARTRAPCRIKARKGEKCRSSSTITK